MQADPATRIIAERCRRHRLRRTALADKEVRLVAPAFDQQKFKQAVLYVCEQSGADPRFGSTKLNKVLFYADFRAYVELGNAITWATYQNLPEGPAPREMLPMRSEMVAEGTLKIEQRSYFNRQQKRPVALVSPDISVFTNDELVILEATVSYLWEKDAAEASDLSHREWGWKLTEEREDIPYAMAWLSPDPPTQDEMEFADQIASV